MKKTIKVYTTTTCAYCEMVKKLFNSKGLDFTAINMDDAPEIRQQVIEMSGAMTVPVTVVEDEEGNVLDLTVGWNPAKLSAAVRDMVAV